MDSAISESPARYLMTYFRHAQVTLTMVAGDAFGVLEPRHPHEVFLVQDTGIPRIPRRRWQPMGNSSGRMPPTCGTCRIRRNCMICA